MGTNRRRRDGDPPGALRIAATPGDTARMDGVPVTRIGRAIDATVAAGNARVATHTSFDGPVPGEADARGVGVIDFANDRSQITDQTITARMLDRSEQRDSPWVRRMKRFLSSPVELHFDGGPRYLQDPLWFLSLLRGANDDVAVVGSSDVRATPTQHLRLTSDFHRAARETPGGLAMPDVEPRRLLRRGPVPTTPLPVPAEVWLDDDQRIRRVSVSPLVRRGDESVLWSVVEFWDFGSAPDIALL
jgi:hypothetical protein